MKVSRKKIQVEGLTKKQGHSEKCRGEISPEQMKEHCDAICVLVKKSVISASYCEIDCKGRVSKYDEAILEFVIQLSKFR